MHENDLVRKRWDAGTPRLCGVTCGLRKDVNNNIFLGTERRAQRNTMSHTLRTLGSDIPRSGTGTHTINETENPIYDLNTYIKANVSTPEEWIESHIFTH